MKERGFTLIELVVVLAVLGILAGIGVPYMMGYRNRAAHGVNVVNLLTTRRQIEAVRQAFPGDITGELKVAEKEEESGLFFLRYEDWDITAPVALGVYPGNGVVAVAEGALMKAWLENGRMQTSYVEEGGTPEPEEEVVLPTESIPEETTEPPTEPAVQAHACRDRNGNCVCDITGCGAVMHEENPFKKDGYCQKCGLHFIHSGMEDDVCDGCRVDGTTGQTHVCSWEEGVCRCRCGESRCDHGPSGVGKCAICGNFNVWTEPCENCKKKG